MSRIVVIAILVAAGLLGWLIWQQSRPVPLIVSGFIEADEIRVGSRVGGRVTEVLVVEGQTVAAGQPLYRLDPFDLREQLAQAEGQRAAAAAELARLKAGFRVEEKEQARAKRDGAAAALARLEAGARPQEREIARARVAIANADLELARSEFERVTNMSPESRVKIELERATRALTAAQNGLTTAEKELSLIDEGARKEDKAEARAILAEAQAAVKLVESGYRAEDIARAEAQLALADASVKAVQTRMNELTVVAPAACAVEAIDLHPGDLAPANAPSATLLDLSHLWVRAYIPESSLGRIRRVCPFFRATVKWWDTGLDTPDFLEKRHGSAAADGQG